MGNVLGQLKPSGIWQNFEKICTIPRPSKHEQKMANYVRDFGKSCGLETIMDEVGNVIIRKPAAPGMEDRRTVVFQTHLDMVPQKDQDLEHNFETDPIRPRIEGDTVKAHQTTLGADNGIGVAAAMAVLESKELVHGPLEALFTIDEEAGMTGANGLKPGLLQGDILFNLDSEDEGELCIGCAGGLDAIAQSTFKEELVPSEVVTYKVLVSGLKGGHSGIDIQLGRANANKVLTRVLWEGRRQANLQIAFWEGGDMRNAIPRYAQAVCTVAQGKADAFEKKAKSVIADIQHEFKDADPELTVKIEKSDPPSGVMSSSQTEQLLNALYACPHGVFAMIREMPTITETSTNLGIVKVEKGSISVTSLLRSSVESKKDDVANMLRSTFALMGAEMTTSGGYPAWQPNVTSPVIKMLDQVYQKQFGKSLAISATHGGLECGIIRAVYPNMDAVSFGPTIRFPHTPDELVEIPSVQKFWDFLLEALKEIPSR